MQQTHVLAPSPITTNPDPWLSLREAAAYARCHEATLRRLIRTGLLRHARVGAGRKIIRLRRSWIDDALIACATPMEVSR